MKVRNLQELLELLKEGASFKMDMLPTFGGRVPRSTTGVWSWDEKRLLVGEGINDLRIVSREEWKETSC